MESSFILTFMADKIKYTVNSLTDKLSNDAVEILCDKDLCEIRIIPHKILSEISLEVIYPLNITQDTLIYCNGFQSWSYSREYTVNERYDSIPKILRPLLKKMGVLNIGDESFAPQPRKKGIFKSSAHFYTRKYKSDNIELVGSIDENIGYTSFIINCNTSTLTAVKDLEGLTINRETVLYKIVKITDEYNNAWDKYFKECGVKLPIAAPLIGYSSWYNNYRNISESTILRNFEAITELDGNNINLFQIDDGYQPTIGDITDIDTVKFPNGLKPIVNKIHEKSLKAGLWICPFGATKKSRLFKEHNDWIVKNSKNKPIKAGIAWGGFYAIDIYNQSAVEYIKKSFSTVIKDWGFDLLKLDFLYCAAIQPRNGKTRAMIMNDAVKLLRDCAPNTPIIGCGAPITPSYNAFEYMRIGADCSFAWGSMIDKVSPEMLSTRKTTLNMLYRRYYDGRAFFNDPDVFYIRESNIKMPKSKKQLHAQLCKMSGSVMLTSDDTSEYDDAQKEDLLKMFNEPRSLINSVERANRYIRINFNDNKSHIIFDYKSGDIVNKN